MPPFFKQINMSVHVLRQKFEAFVNNMNQNIIDAIAISDSQVLDLQREQMKGRQVTALDSPILPEYSSYWKSMKGLTYPNLYDTGDFQNNLKLNTNGQQYLIQSTDWKNEKLKNKYKNIFGIAPSNQGKAKEITSKAIGQLLKSKIQ